MNEGSSAEAEQADRGGALARGANIGRYVVLGMVGRGGMGEVYAAYDPELNRKVAVKLVRARQDVGPVAAERRARLLREAQAIARLSHPNVVVIYDVGTLGDSVFIAMEFVEGRTVGGWLLAAPRAWRDVLTVYQAAGNGLAAAHQAGMVHRDFKPDNVMLAPDGQVRVMDFGLARQVLGGERLTGSFPVVSSAFSLAASNLDPAATLVLGRDGEDARQPAASPELDGRLTQTGTLLGTPAYMAPEQFLQKPADQRTDQFSFCVALYEGLYGERPFPGATAEAVMTSVLAGTVSEAPAAARVPAWIRRTLLRGLRTNPAERYPSMPALLSALHHDPARLRRRWAAILIVATALVGFAVSARHLSRSVPGPCTGGPQKLAGLWEIEYATRGRIGTGAEGPRRTAIHRAFSATGMRFAESAFTGVAAALDRYLRDWTEMYTDTCQATQVRGEQSTEVLDLRMSCLSERLDQARALTDVFMTANATVVENAISAVSSLPALDRCADVKLLRDSLPLPDDRAMRAKVDSLRRSLAQVRALGDSGECAAGAAAGSKLVDDAFTIGYLPVRAEALNALASFGSECTEPARAVRQYKEALWAAEASHNDEVAAEALISMARLGADRLHEIGPARDWIQLASAILQRMGPGHPALEASKLAALGIVSIKEGQVDDGLAFLDQSLELMRKTHGEEHIQIVRTLNDIGEALQEQGRFADSIPPLGSAQAMAQKIVGPDHPLMALTLDHEGRALNALGRYADARSDLDRAIQIWRNAGSEPFYIAHALADLGECLLGLGQARAAQDDFEEALRLSASGPSGSLPAARFGLARALRAAHREAPRAVALARQAKLEYESTDAAPWRIAQIDDWLGPRVR